MNSERFLTTVLFFPVMPSIFAFSSETKKIIAENADYKCQCCGMPTTRGQCHHMLPQCNGGSDEVVNGVYLCGENEDEKDCHEVADRKVLNKGIMFNDLPISRATPDQIKDINKWKEACKKFEKPKSKNFKNEVIITPKVENLKKKKRQKMKKYLKRYKSY